MEPQARKRVRVPDYEYNNNVVARSSKRIKKEGKIKQEIKTESEIKQEPTNNITTEAKITIKSEIKSNGEVKLKKGKTEQQVEIRDLVDDVLLSVFNLLFTLRQMNDLTYVKKIIRLGALSKQFRRVEKKFWRQIVDANPLFSSKLKLTKYKDNGKLLHLTHHFGCYECRQLTRYCCEECKTPLCLQCYEDHYAPECNCFAAWPHPLCQYCYNRCSACDRRICGSCSKDCKKCGVSACKTCCKEKHECFGCNSEMCIHALELIKCQCEKPRYICTTRYEDEDHLRCSTTCYQCPKEICDECSDLCQNCSHHICRKCSMKIGEWTVCRQGCIGKGLKVAKCHHCEENFVYMNKDLDIEHCGKCENQKFCKTCVEYCAVCNRKLCMACLFHHEENCSGHVKCQKCQTQVSTINLCNTCEREAGCDKCCINCRTCNRIFCNHCITFSNYRIYDRTSDSFKKVREAECNSCLTLGD